MLLLPFYATMLPVVVYQMVALTMRLVREGRFVWLGECRQCRKLPVVAFFDWLSAALGSMGLGAPVLRALCTRSLPLRLCEAATLMLCVSILSGDTAYVMWNGKMVFWPMNVVATLNAFTIGLEMTF